MTSRKASPATSPARAKHKSTATLQINSYADNVEAKAVAAVSATSTSGNPFVIASPSQQRAHPPPAPFHFMLIASRSSPLTRHEDRHRGKPLQDYALALCRDPSLLRGVALCAFNNVGKMTNSWPLSEYAFHFSGDRILLDYDDSKSPIEWQVSDVNMGELKKFRANTENLSDPLPDKLPNIDAVTRHVKTNAAQTASTAKKSSVTAVGKQKLPYANVSSRATALTTAASASQSKFTRPQSRAPVLSDTPTIIDEKELETPAASALRNSWQESNRVMTQARREQEQLARDQITSGESIRFTTGTGATRRPVMGSKGYTGPNPLRAIYGRQTTPPIGTRPIGSYFNGSSSSSYRSSIERTGFENVGNSCYINAVLQALLGMPSFLTSLTADRVMGARHQLERQMPDGSVYRTLFNMANQRGQQGAVDTKSMKTALGKRNRMFSGYAQQDAHEFFSECLNFIHEDVEDCLLTDAEVKASKQAEEVARKKAAAATTKPSAAAAASSSAIEEKKDAFAFDTDDEDMTTAPPPRAASASSSSSSAAAAATVPASSTAASSSNNDVDIPASPDANDEGEEEESKSMMQDIPSSNGGSPSAAATAPTTSVSPIPPIISLERQEELDAKLLRLSPVLLNFQCEVELELACQAPKCTNKRIVREIFHDFSVDLPEKTSPRPLTSAASSSSRLTASVTTKPSTAAAASSNPLQLQAPLSSSTVDDAPTSHSSPIVIDSQDSLPDTIAASAASKVDSKNNGTQASIHISIFDDEKAKLDEKKKTPDLFDVLKANSARQTQQSAPIHLTALVEQFFQPRIIEYRCTCGYDQLSQVSRISHLPRILVLHLKRFQFDERTYRFEKRKDIVKFDAILDMTHLVNDNVKVPQVEGASNGIDLSPSSSSASSSSAAAATTPTRKRKERDASPVPSARNSKVAKVEFSVFEQAQQRYDIAMKKLTAQHKVTCPHKTHDNCLHFALAQSELEAKFEQEKRDLASSNGATVPAASSSAAAAASSSSIAAPAAPDYDTMDEDQQLEAALAASTAAPPVTSNEMDDVERAIAASLQSVEDEKQRQRTHVSVRHTYRLISVILHKGETASSGHYVSHILEEEAQSTASPSASNGNGTSKPSAAAASSSSASAAAFSSSSSSSRSPTQSKIGPSPRASTANASKPLMTKRIWKEYDDAYVTKLDDTKAQLAAEREGYIFFYEYQPNATPPPRPTVKTSTATK